MPVVFIRKKPFFTTRQLLRLANIFDNAGQVFLGIAVLSPIIEKLVDIDTLDMMMIVLGLVSTLFCWMASVWFTRKADNYDF